MSDDVLTGLISSERTETMKLTRTELDVLMLMAEGRSDVEIARELAIDPNLIQRHVDRIIFELKRLSLDDVVADIVIAIQLGLVGRSRFAA